MTRERAARHADIDVAVFQVDAGCPAADRPAALDARLAAIDGRKPDLVVCPELFSTGYAADPDAIRAAAEAVDGGYVAEMGALARRHGTALHFGFAERDGARLFNASVTVDASGAVIGRYRKRVLPPGYEAEVFTPGDGGPPIEIAGVRIQPLICYEVEFPECVRAAALGGADLVLVPTALRSMWRFVAEKMIPVRAFENRVFLVYANYAGTDGVFDYLGGSRIEAPDGETLAAGGADAGVVRARLETARIDAALEAIPYFRDLPQIEN